MSAEKEFESLIRALREIIQDLERCWEDQRNEAYEAGLADGESSAGEHK